MSNLQGTSSPHSLDLSSPIGQTSCFGFPYQIGYDCSGVVTQVGEDASDIKVGDEVYARLPEADRGSWSEYAKCPERYVALKPKNLSFEDAASLPLAGMTALQTLSRYQGSLSGKTVFIPAGLIDYTKQDPLQIIPRGSVHFVLDTTGEAMSFLPLMASPDGLIVSIATQPSGTQLQQSSVMKRPDSPRLPWFGHLVLDILDKYRRTRAKWWGVAYEYLFLDPNAKDLVILARHVEEGNVIPIVGCTVDLKNIEDMKEACGTVYNGKGGLGKTVIKVASA
ncbi:alcohol dehydrogenase [Diaporthe amygdali]|uniref:alcohol dehydrogenase n=1 Tax=Phomopsis amygdali TaxID=1214568 RepID=UPI0022FE4E6C|nr:alcohol dehydrogenase [Diaporthe amygdali]KAJ0115116.1 alcohol dehydrogenase [Diaporthe amygdali]